jgi:RNA polymerase sigma factor (sigma-70 family)
MRTMLTTKRSRIYRRPTPAALVPRNDPLAYVDAEDEATVALRKLPRRHRNILGIMAFEGLTQRDMARDLGCSEMTVSRVVREARRLLGA